MEPLVQRSPEHAARRPTMHDLIAETGERVRTIHYWTTMGVIPKPRGAGLQASYDPDTPTRIRAIRRLQAAQLRMDAIREMMESATPEDLGAWADGAVPGRVARTAGASGAAAGAADGRPAAGAIERAIRREIAPGIEVLVSERASLREPTPRMYARLDALLDEARRAFGRADAPPTSQEEES